MRKSGKIQLIKGSLRYLWEEAKTLNHSKLRALKEIISGYFRMKYRDQKRPRKRLHEISSLER